MVVWDLRFGFCDFSLWYSWDLDFGISDFGFLYLRFEDWICRVWELWIRDVFMSLAMLLHCVPPLSPRRVSPQLARLPSAFACLRVARDSQPGRAPLFFGFLPSFAHSHFVQILVPALAEDFVQALTDLNGER